MKILVCGSRSWTDTATIDAVLDKLLATHGPFELIEGEARGADRIAATWAERHNITVHPFPADWAEHGKVAGPRRNIKMLTEGQPDLVIAFTNNITESRGTGHMVSIAQHAGVPTRIVGAANPPTPPTQWDQTHVGT